MMKPQHISSPRSFSDVFDASRTNERRSANDYQAKGSQSGESHAGVESSHHYLPCHCFDFVAGTNTGGQEPFSERDLPQGSLQSSC
jgi:hypothetical protein